MERCFALSTISKLSLMNSTASSLLKLSSFNLKSSFSLSNDKNCSKSKTCSGAAKLKILDGRLQHVQKYFKVYKLL